MAGGQPTTQGELQKAYRIRYGSVMSCAAARGFERAAGDHLAKFSGSGGRGDLSLAIALPVRMHEQTIIRGAAARPLTGQTSVLRRCPKSFPLLLIAEKLHVAALRFRATTGLMHCKKAVAENLKLLEAAVSTSRPPVSGVQKAPRQVRVPYSGWTRIAERQNCYWFSPSSARLSALRFAHESVVAQS